MRRTMTLLAVVALVATGVVIVARLRSRAVEPRDAPAPPAVPALQGLDDRPLSLAEPLYAGDGSVRVAWRGVRGADRYVLRFFSTTMQPIGDADAGRDTSVTLLPRRLPDALHRGELVLYRVAAMRGRDELAVSETRPLKRP